MASLLKNKYTFFLQYSLNFLFSPVHSISVFNAKTVNLVLSWVETHYASVKSWAMSSFYVKELLFSLPGEHTLSPQIFQRGIQSFARNSASLWWLASLTSSNIKAWKRTGLCTPKHSSQNYCCFPCVRNIEEMHKNESDYMRGKIRCVNSFFCTY